MRNPYRLTSLLALSMLLIMNVAGAQPDDASAETYNGFDLNNLAVPLADIHAAGVPRDGIPALMEPEFIALEQAQWHPRTRIIGVAVGNVAHAYPLPILNWHEAVNDSINGHPVLVSYSPLTGTAMAFRPQVNDVPLTFGVSGLVYNNGALLYDTQTGSLWSQLDATAISGPLRAEALLVTPVVHTTWEDWQQRYPDSQVLSANTGYNRNYQRNPYSNYAQHDELEFPALHALPADIHPKEIALGVQINNASRAYLFSELRDYEQPVIQDRLGGQDITIHWDPFNLSANVTLREGGLLPSVTGYVFAWYATHPDTDFFAAEQGPQAATDDGAI